MIKLRLKDFDIEVIRESGQVFRIYNEGPKYTIYNNDKILFLHKILTGPFNYEASCSKKEWNSYWAGYFDLKTNYDKYRKVCKSNDKFLKECIKFSKGLRLLNQDHFEMLISFIISQRKSVPAIRTSIERLCKVCGKKKIIKNKTYYLFPTASEILKNKNKLSSCGLGYRMEYIIEAANKVNKNIINLKKLENASDEELLNALMSIKGVGIKVASCIALFSYKRYSICPVDVWIGRVIDKYYKGKIPREYNKYIGIIQQYWFNYSRLNKI